MSLISDGSISSISIFLWISDGSHVGFDLNLHKCAMFSMISADFDGYITSFHYFVHDPDSSIRNCPSIL